MTHIKINCRKKTLLKMDDKMAKTFGQKNIKYMLFTYSIWSGTVPLSVITSIFIFPVDLKRVGENVRGCSVMR